MVRSSSSSTSSCASIGSLEDVSVKSGGSSGASAVKFLCSYGGKILPRYPDGKLRYVGGDTRVLAVDRSVSYSGSLDLPLNDEDAEEKKGMLFLGASTVNLQAELNAAADSN